MGDRQGSRATESEENRLKEKSKDRVGKKEKGGDPGQRSFHASGAKIGKVKRNPRVTLETGPLD